MSEEQLETSLQSQSLLNPTLSTLHLIPKYLIVTKKELIGFYSIGISSNPYNMIGLVICIPLLLESFSAQAGTLFDGITPCDTSKTGYRCFIPLLGIKLDSSAFSLFTMALSVALQAILFIALSALADFGGYRKWLLIISSVISILSMLSLAIIQDVQYYWLIALFSIICNVAFGVTTVYFYAYINTYTRYHPTTVAALAIQDQQHYIKVKDQVGNMLSTNVAIYSAIATLFTMLSCLLVLYYFDNVKGLQISCIISCIVWLIGIIIQCLFIKKREGPPLPKNQNLLFFSFKETYQTIKQVNKMPNTFWYLMSWMLLSDGFASVSTVGILFAKVELGMEIKELFFMVLMITLSGMLGLIFWLKLQKIFNLTTIQMLRIITLLSCITPLYGIIGIFTLKMGLHFKWELFLFSCFHGFLAGALGSYSRVQFSELIPSGKENQFFGLYEISDNGSSWIGPFLIGAIEHFSQNLRYGFLLILPMLLLSFVLLYFVNISKGIEDARNFEESETHLDTTNNYGYFDLNQEDPDLYEEDNFDLKLTNMNNMNNNNNNNNNENNDSDYEQEYDNDNLEIEQNNHQINKSNTIINNPWA